MYVRDLAPFYASLYSQCVKRDRYTGSLGEIVAGEQRTRFRPRLSYLLQAVGRENLTLLHYDSERHELFPSFIRRVLGHEPDTSWSLPPLGVNRSLTRHEIALMRRLNHRLTSRRQGDLISRTLVEFGPSGRTPLGITEAEIALLEEKFGDDVAWINNEFFGEPRLSIRGGAPIVRTDSPDDHLAPERSVYSIAWPGSSCPPTRTEPGNAPRSTSETSSSSDCRPSSRHGRRNATRWRRRARASDRPLRWTLNSKSVVAG